MTTWPRLLLYCLLVLFGLRAPGVAIAETIVERVEVEGNRRVDQALVLLQVDSQPGNPLDLTQVQKDIKSIYRTGYFSTVVAKTERAEADRVTLIFSLAEKPAIQNVYLKGNSKVSDSSFLEKLNLGARRFLDERRVRSSVEQVKTYYQQLGYYGTQITYEVTPQENNLVDLTFIVEEGEKQRIREVVFEGNKNFRPKELQNEVNTMPYRWWSSWVTGRGSVKEEVLAQDVAALNRFYMNSGYVDVRVTDPVVSEVESGLRVTFKIDEGPQYRTGTISARGSLIEASVAQTLDGASLKQGEIFSAGKLRDDTFGISEKFTDIGYAFVNVEPITSIDRENLEVNVTYEIDQGELIRISRINVTGNKKTADNVIRRSLTIFENDLFSSSKIRRSQELLGRLGHFEEVTITPDPALEKDEVNLTVAVREGATGSFSAGAGISSGDGFILMTRVSENNLFGSGNSLSFDVHTGSRRENFILSFENPRVRDSRWSFVSDLASYERDYSTFRRKEAGASVGVGYPLWFLGEKYLEDVRFGLSYELVQITIDDLSERAPLLVRNEEGKTVSSSVKPRIVRNTINNPLDPTRGSRQLLSFEIAGLGGDEEFWLMRSANTVYYPIVDLNFGPIIFSQRTQFNYGESFNDDPLPLFRRFFAGGINSVRGFQSRKLGPADENGERYGGSKELVANFETILPLVPGIGLQFVAFYDIGNAFAEGENISVSELRQAVGWGIRWRSPIAPIRIEFGYPLSREPGEDSVVTNFSLGAPM